MLITLSISLILLSFAFNHYQAVRIQIDAQRTFLHLEQAILLGRGLAKSHPSTWRLCPIGPQNDCGVDWNQGFILGEYEKGRIRKLVKKYPGPSLGRLKASPFFQDKFTFSASSTQIFSSQGHFDYLYQGKIMLTLVINQNRVYQKIALN